MLTVLRSGQRGEVILLHSKGHQAKCALSATMSKMRGVPDAPTYRSMRITSYRAACNRSN
jgi:hypothetical protein